jgi:acyl dehydratase
VPIDHARALALELPSVDVLVERGRLRAFAAATGDTDPVHSDAEAARAAGHPDVLAMPTFLFSLELEAPDPLGWIDQVGADLRGVLHGEQTFTYAAPIHAGDTIAVRPRIAAAYAKNERMDFVVKHTDFLRDGELVGSAESLIVLRAVVPA